MCFKKDNFSGVKIAVQSQLIVHFTKYSVKCGGYQRERPAVTVLLAPLSACSYSCKTLCPLTEATPTPHLFIHLPLLPALPPRSSSFSTPILCSVKLTLLSMLRTIAGCLVGKEDKHWQGTSIVLSSHNNQRISASFDFPTVWLSLVWQYLVQTPNQTLSLLLYITFSPLFFFQTVGRGNFCARGAESLRVGS